MSIENGWRGKARDLHILHRTALLELFLVCEYCRQDFDKPYVIVSRGGKSLTVDNPLDYMQIWAHIKDHAFGGKLTPGNVFPAHCFCDGLKKHAPLDWYLDFIGVSHTSAVTIQEKSNQAAKIADRLLNNPRSINASMLARALNLIENKPNRTPENLTGILYSLKRTA